MSLMQSTATAAAITALAVLLAPAARADEYDSIEADLKAANVPTSFKVIASIGAFCTLKTNAFYAGQLNEEKVTGVLAKQGMTTGQAGVVWSSISKNCVPKSN